MFFKSRPSQFGTAAEMKLGGIKIFSQGIKHPDIKHKQFKFKLKFVQFKRKESQNTLLRGLNDVQFRCNCPHLGPKQTYKLTTRRTWLLLPLGPQEIDLGGQTSPRRDGHGGDGHMRDGRRHGPVERGARACRGGDSVSGGKDGAEGGGDGEPRHNSAEHVVAAEIPRVGEAVECVEEWRRLVG